ncbi:MAG: hypothetical protein R3C59_00020 [Planctomycetaceae bacterium]
MYNVLEKLRAGEPLTDKEKVIHEQGLVSVLKQIHDDLDAAVFAAYGWPHDLSDEDILERLVALNHERAEEEKRGLIRWLRPESQNPDGAQEKVQTTPELEDDDEPTAKKPKVDTTKKQVWPKTLPEQMAGVRRCLVEANRPIEPSEIALLFEGYRKSKDGPSLAAFVEELLDTLVAIGQARQTDSSLYVVTN